MIVHFFLEGSFVWVNLLLVAIFLILLESDMSSNGFATCTL